MGAARKRRGKRRGKRYSSRPGTDLGEAARAALSGLRTIAAWLLSVPLRLGRWLAGAGWDWYRSQRLAVQVGLPAALLLAALIVRSRGGPVYAETDTEALARVIRSEIGIGTAQERLHVAWATRNLAESRGESIVEMACSPCGEQKAGRPVSSRQEATDADRELARLVLDASPLLDPTGGATHFINPTLQDELARKRVPGYADRPYRHVRRIWQERYGWHPYYRLGPTLEFWGEEPPSR